MSANDTAAAAAAAMMPPMVDGFLMVAPAPEGWVVNLANPTRDEATITAIWWTLGWGNAIAFLFLAQNLYVKWALMRKLQIETILLLLSYGMGIFVCAWLIDTIRIHTTGVHLWEVKFIDMQQFSLIYYVCSTVYIVQLAVLKCAIALFYRRISPAKSWVWTINGVMVFIVIFTTIVTFISIFACNPVSASWDLMQAATAKCIDRNPLYLVVTSTNILLDIVLVCLPIPMVLKLQMGRKQKIGIIVTFIIGGATTITSIMRLVILVPLLKDADQTFGMTKAILWIVIEANLMVICASMPTLRRFGLHVAPKLMSDSFINSNGATGGKYGRTGESGNSGFRTIGQVTQDKKKRVDKHGMTINDEEADLDGTFDMPFQKPLELTPMGYQHNQSNIVTGNPKKKNSRDGGRDPTRLGGKERDAASTSSLESQDTRPKNSTWDPVGAKQEDDERAIVQTRTYTVRRD